MIKIDKLFRLAADDVCCNTSYPLSPEYFAEYRDADFDIMSGVGDLSFYLHVPFCRSLCRFCEYTRVRCGDEHQESHYVDLLEREIHAWVAQHDYGRMMGIDVGGGTPTAISDRNFTRVMCLAKELASVRCDEKMEPSIEFSYSTINEMKLAAIADAGFTRGSTGLQLVDDDFLMEMDRESPGLAKMKFVNDLLREAGVVKINLDVMYGFEGQTPRDFESTIRAIELLRPEQVTLYETRYNMNTLPHVGVTRETNYSLYSFLYDRLSELGYMARFGQNAFSFMADEGVSSYLCRRMFDGTPYKGFGASAQSMSEKGLSYNALKGFDGDKFPRLEEISEKDIYRLPGEELVAKYVAVALYGGKFHLPVVSRLLGADACVHYAAELDYLIGGDYITVDAYGWCFVTRRGFREYGAIAALFWSNAHKRKWLMSKDSL